MSIAKAMGLTKRQGDIAELLCEGLITKQIAGRLGICKRTVEIHIGDIKKRLGAKNITQAALIYDRRAREITAPTHCGEPLESVLFHHAGEERVRGKLCRVCGHFEDFYPDLTEARADG